MRRLILVTPGIQLKKNIHLKLLYRVLKKNGYRVLPFSIKNVVRYGRKAIWHIHWIDQFYRGNFQRIGVYNTYHLISIIRVFIFLFQISLSKMMNAKIIWTVHNITSHEYGETFFEKFVIKSLLMVSDRVTAYNHFTKDMIKKKTGFNDVFIMQRGLYEDTYSSLFNQEDAKQKLNIDSSCFVLLLFGALLPYKGVDILIKSLKQIHDEKIVLVIAGTTAKNIRYGDELRALASEDNRVILIDRFISENEIPILFSAADYSIYPYRRISNSGVLFMSLTFGVPTIISDRGGVREIINIEPEIGILMDEADNENIIKAINLAKKKEKNIKAMERIQEKLSWKHLEKSIVEVFQL